MTERSVPKSHARDIADACVEITDKAINWREKARAAEQALCVVHGLLSSYAGQQTSAGEAFRVIDASLDDHLNAEFIADRAKNYKSFTDGLEAAAQICGSLAETTYDDADAFEAATGCEAAIMAVVKDQRKEQRSEP